MHKIKNLDEQDKYKDQRCATPTLKCNEKEQDSFGFEDTTKLQELVSTSV